MTKMSYARAGGVAGLPRGYNSGSMPEGRVTAIFEDGRGELGPLRKGYDGDRVREAVRVAEGAYADLVGGQELQVQSFQGYGSTLMKKNKISPDAYVQMAVQLASFRLFGKCVATYEASQVRPYKHGRTETTRSCSLDHAARQHTVSYVFF